MVDEESATHTKGEMQRAHMQVNSRALRVVVGGAGKNECPHGAVPLNANECRNLPRAVGGSLHRPLVIESDKDPRGCFAFQYNKKYRWIYFNKHPVGVERDRRIVYCKSAVIDMASDASETALISHTETEKSDSAPIVT